MNVFSLSKKLILGVLPLFLYLFFIFQHITRQRLYTLLAINSTNRLVHGGTSEASKGKIISMDINKIFDELFPICRSIAGEGMRSSLSIINKYVPFEIFSVPTGTKIFDWEIPQEWKLNHARLISPQGEIIIDSDDSNLHVLNFSEPFFGKISLEELQEHLYSIPDLPSAIPYVTSYYHKRWGLCLTDEKRANLASGTYTVEIDTEKKDGFLNFGVYDLPGDTEEIFLISTYFCHPSLANNELSGPMCMLRLYDELKKIKNRRYTYRFVIAPETIGSLTYLATQGHELINKIVGGVVLTCLGGSNKQISFKLTRQHWVGDGYDIDSYVKNLALFDPDYFEYREFSPTSGSDERQYCSPGFNLPVVQAAKTIYGQYNGYHNSFDTKEWMNINSVEDSAQQLLKFIQIFEIKDLKLINTIKGGEPQLSKRNLYPTFNGPMSNKMSSDMKKDARYQLNLLLNILSLSDGTRDILAISEKLNASLLDIYPVLMELVAKEVLELKKRSNLL